MTPRPQAQRLDPVGSTVEVLGGELATAHRQQARAEGAAVEPVTPLVDHRPQGSRGAGATEALAVGHRSGGPVLDVGHGGDRRRHEGQEDRCRPAVLGVLDGRGQDLGQREAPEAVVKGTPSVDTAGHGHGSDVAPERHHPVTLGPQPLGIGTRAGPSRRVQGHWRPEPVVHQRQQIAPHPTEVGVGDGQHGIGPDGSVDGRATPAQQRRTRRRGQVVGTADQPRRGVNSGRERDGAHRRHRTGATMAG